MFVGKLKVFATTTLSSLKMVAIIGVLIGYQFAMSVIKSYIPGLMNKHTYKQKMLKIKWATLQQGEKWDNKARRLAQEYITATTPKKENWKGETKTEKLSGLLSNLLKGVK
jgi:hypothetical protein